MLSWYVDLSGIFRTPLKSLSFRLSRPHLFTKPHVGSLRPYLQSRVDLQHLIAIETGPQPPQRKKLGERSQLCPVDELRLHLRPNENQGFSWMLIDFHRCSGIFMDAHRSSSIPAMTNSPASTGGRLRAVWNAVDAAIIAQQTAVPLALGTLSEVCLMTWGAFQTPWSIRIIEYWHTHRCIYDMK